MPQTPQTQTNFNFLNNANATTSPATMLNNTKTQTFANFANNAQASGGMPSLQSFKNTNATPATPLSKKQIGQERLNQIQNAQNAQDLTKPKYTIGAGFGNYKAQKEAYNAKVNEFNAQNPQGTQLNKVGYFGQEIKPQTLTQEQKSEKGRNIAGWTLAGIDSAVNIANAGMSYANMTKQWEMQNKMYDLAREQQDTENKRYEKREQERLDARDDARSAQKAVFGNREWYDANASQDGEGESTQNNEGENGEDKTAFIRD